MTTKENNVTTISSLPEKNVLFLGGHQNMIKKLKQRYPYWQFITDDRLTMSPKPSTAVIFFWSKHSSHKLYRSVRNCLSKNVPMIYVTATNLDALEEEMLTKLSAA